MRTIKPQPLTPQGKTPADFAAKLLKHPRDVKERPALEVFIARELYGLSLDDWKHLTATFTFGSGPTRRFLCVPSAKSVVEFLWLRSPCCGIVPLRGKKPPEKARRGMKTALARKNI